MANPRLPNRFTPLYRNASDGTMSPGAVVPGGGPSGLAQVVRVDLDGAGAFWYGVPLNETTTIALDPAPSTAFAATAQYLKIPGGAGNEWALWHGNSLGAAFVTEGQDDDLGYEQIIGLAASTALTVPTGATKAIITTEAQNVRWRADGVAPTAAVGYPLLVGQELEYNADLANIRFIQTAATATLNITYFS